MTNNLIDRKLYPWLFALTAAAIVGIGMLFANMPKVSFATLDEMNAIREATYQAMDAKAGIGVDNPESQQEGYATCDYSAAQFPAMTRCQWPDGLDCVRAADGGITCNWDAYNASRGE